MALEEIGRDGFESGFYEAPDPYEQIEHEPHLTIPVLWSVGWVQGTNGNVRPEWKPKDKQAGQPEVFEGRYAAGVHHSTAKYDTVLWRYIDATVGAHYRFEAQMLPKNVDPASGFALAIGIDPFGGTDWGSPDVIYHWYAVWDSFWKDGEWYKNISDIVEAKSTRITLYLRAWCRFPANAAVAFDDTRLYSDEDQVPEPPEPPTDGVTEERVREIAQEEVAKLEAQITRMLTTLPDMWGSV